PPQKRVSQTQLGCSNPSRPAPRQEYGVRRLFPVGRRTASRRPFTRSRVDGANTACARDRGGVRPPGNLRRAGDNAEHCRLVGQWPKRHLHGFRPSRAEPAIMMRAFYPWLIAGMLVVTLRELPAQEVRPRLNFQAHPSSTRVVGITADDKLLITKGDDGVKAWDLSTGKERVLAKLTGQALALSPDGKVVALANDRSARLWDIFADKEVAAFKEHPFPVGAVAFSRDGKTLATAWTKPDPRPRSQVAVVALWEVATGKQIRMLESGPGALSGLAISPDGNL